ncbi:MAG: TPM domain-containing protein [Clostridia bacterium]|nr:TPM domain-containing protein [Clostridia bacterium]
MKKTVVSLILAILLFSICLTPVSATTIDYWYPENQPDFQNFHGSNLPRVVDNAEILTDSEEEELSAAVQKIVDTYNIGYVIFTDTDNHGLSKEVYSADFLYYNGYGVGDTYDAVVFYLSLEEGNRGWRTTSIGKCEEIFNADVTYEIDELVDNDIRNKGDYYSAFKKHIEYVDSLMHEKNSFPVKKFLLGVLIGYVIGLIVSLIYVSGLKKKMRVVSPVDAKEYLADGSYVVHDKSVDYLYTTVTKVAKPQDNDRSGGSSFSSGSSSSGGSFSSGGRDF